MSNYTIENKEAFTVLGIGVELTSDYTDYAGINAEKTAFLNQVNEDGTIKKLKSLATTNDFFTVNEAVNNKMMYYVGVRADETVPEATRMIEFPKGEYLVIKGEASTAEELSNLLTGMAFGQVLPTVTDYAYVGGPNAVVEMDTKNGMVSGEIWVPVVNK